MLMRMLLGVCGATGLFCLIAGCASGPSGMAPAISGTTSGTASQRSSAPLQEPFSSALSRWNYYRTSAGVPPVVADPALNEAALHHAKYLVNNHLDAGDAVISDGRMIETGWNASAHFESVGNQWFTEDGAKWGQYANVIRGTAPVTDGAALVDEQATRTDSLAVLDPQLVSVGFGIFCVTGDCAGVIVYNRGLTKSQFLALYQGNAMDWNAMLGVMPFTIARLRKPIEFPSTGMQFPSRAFRGGDYPNPLTACPGYSAPTGTLIVLQLGAPMEGQNVKVSSSSLSDGGAQLETCAFDATSYANPDGYQQDRAREILHAYGAVMVIPKSPLQPGHEYQVSIVADSQPYNWSFAVAPGAK
jgi:hypothetical protein